MTLKYLDKNADSFNKQSKFIFLFYLWFCCIKRNTYNIRHYMWKKTTSALPPNEKILTSPLIPRDWENQHKKQIQECVGYKSTSDN